MTQKEKLRERKIYNDYEIANLGDKIYVGYSSNDGRSCFPSWWSVHYIGRKFKGSAWYEHGARTFFGKKRDTNLMIKALTFASKIINCYEWVKTPFGDYVSIFTANKVGLKYKQENIIKIKKKIHNA